MLLATVVDTKALLETIAAALGAGIGVTFAFSLAILGGAGFVERGRDGRTASALAFGALAVFALLVCAAAAVLGIVVMTSK
jgi:hypothetical protein